MLHYRWDKGLVILDEALKRKLDVREVIEELKNIEDRFFLLNAKIHVVDESLRRLKRLDEV